MFCQAKESFRKDRKLQLEMRERRLRDWRDVLLTPTHPMSTAISVLDQVALRIVMVVDDKGRLLGTVTDGDIRRGLIKHQEMSTPLGEVMHTDPTVASASDDRESILAMMKAKDLMQIPIVDENHIVVGLETIQHLMELPRHDNPVFLMAGGFGKRLRPLTEHTPKPLLHVGGKPILQTILEQFIAAGFHDFYVSTHYRAEQVREHFGDGGSWGVSIRYTHEPQPLGTAGALGLLPDTLPHLPLVMMNGDLYTQVNFQELLRFHDESGGIATMCVRKYDFQVPYGVVVAREHRIEKIIEKPVQDFFVNAGIYIIDPKLCREVSGNTFLDMPDLLQEQLKKGHQVNMFPVHESWLDIGRIEDYERAQKMV